MKNFYRRLRERAERDNNRGASEVASLLFTIPLMIGMIGVMLNFFFIAIAEISVASIVDAGADRTAEADGDNIRTYNAISGTPLTPSQWTKQTIEIGAPFVESVTSVSCELVDTDGNAGGRASCAAVWTPNALGWAQFLTSGGTWNRTFTTIGIDYSQVGNNPNDSANV